MYALFERYYLATSPDLFQSDLADKDTVFLLHDACGRLCGFSTLSTSRTQVGVKPIRIIFSGDTIIDRAHWGSQAFAFAWLRHIGRISLEAPDEPLYWLLIVKGHRTYRYLPAFGLAFTPDWRRPEDQRLEALKHTVAIARFGDAYDPASGLVRYAKSRGHLAAEWATVSEREASRPDVRFFLERNPGYGRGDELVCLCELQAHNMRPLTRRLFLQGAAP
jgi:hypothetical protein